MAPPSSFSNFLVHRHALPAVHAQFFAAVVKCHEASSVHEAVSYVDGLGVGTRTTGAVVGPGVGTAVGSGVGTAVGSSVCVIVGAAVGVAVGVSI
jgi:hypothetical protein